MNIIGLCGLIGSGKNTAAKYLIEEKGYVQLSFASHLKDITALAFGWDRTLLEGDTTESRRFRETPDPYWSKKLGKDFTPRYALQYVGTEMFRNLVHDDFWIMSLEKKMLQHNNIVISDARFPNEISFLRALGGKIVWIKKDPLPPWFAMAKLGREIPDVHPSEWAWIPTKFDRIVDNNGSLEDFHFQLRNI